MKVALEYLFHFKCDSCEKWWTIGDYANASDTYHIKYTMNSIITCPHCKYENEIEEINDGFENKIKIYTGYEY